MLPPSENLPLRDDVNENRGRRRGYDIAGFTIDDIELSNYPLSSRTRVFPEDTEEGSDRPPNSFTLEEKIDAMARHLRIQLVRGQSNPPYYREYEETSDSDVS